MRPSPQRHTLAVLRTTIGITQKEMAAILECSTPTIQAVELGRLNLSEKLAGLVSHKTGINLAWLLDNNTSKPPIDNNGKPYTLATFEKAQASIHVIKTDGLIGNDAASLSANVNLARLFALILRAHKNDDVAICAYKLAKTFDKLEKDFGVTDEDRAAVDFAHSMKLAIEQERMLKKLEKAKPSSFAFKKPPTNEYVMIQYRMGGSVSHVGFGHALHEETKKKKSVTQYPAPNDYIFASPYAGCKTISHPDGQLHVDVPKKKTAKTRTAKPKSARH